MNDSVDSYVYKGRKIKVGDYYEFVVAYDDVSEVRYGQIKGIYPNLGKVEFEIVKNYGYKKVGTGWFIYVPFNRIRGLGPIYDYDGVA